MPPVGREAALCLVGDSNDHMSKLRKPANSPIETQRSVGKIALGHDFCKAVTLRTLRRTIFRVVVQKTGPRAAFLRSLGPPRAMGNRSMVTPAGSNNGK